MKEVFSFQDEDGENHKRNSSTAFILQFDGEERKREEFSTSTFILLHIK